MTPTHYYGTAGEYTAYRGADTCRVIRRSDGWHARAWHGSGTGSGAAGDGEYYDSGPRGTRAEAADAAFSWLAERARLG